MLHTKGAQIEYITQICIYSVFTDVSKVNSAQIVHLFSAVILDDGAGVILREGFGTGRHRGLVSGISPKGKYP